MSDYATVDILGHCFYHRVGLHRGHPILSVSWPLSPMPLQEINEVYGGMVFSLGSTNTVLIRDGDTTIVHDPGILQLGRYGTLKMRMAELGLTESQAAPQPTDEDNEEVDTDVEQEQAA